MCLDDQELTLAIIKNNAAVFDLIFGAFQPKVERTELLPPGDGTCCEELEEIDGGLV